MKLALSAFVERVRGSLFVVPMAFVATGIALGQLGLVIDDRIGSGSTGLPLGLTSTVASARAVLSTVAGATITVAGIAFSVSLLTIQLASSQYSPRVVSGLFRDPFNKRVIGIVVGTFSYCLIVLRSVRAPIEEQGAPVIPNVSVAVGLLLGIFSILAVVAFINHNAHTMDISEILDGVSRAAVDAVGRHWSHNLCNARPGDGAPLPTGDGFAVAVASDGWVQLLDHERLLTTVPEGGCVQLEANVGEYLVRGSPLCRLWPTPDDPEAAAERCRDSFHLGSSRTLQQDATYGLRQLVDVGLKALSPGINDPTTAQDAIVHIASVLRAFLDREPPKSDMDYDGRRFLVPRMIGPDEIIGLAYDELRLAAQDQPTVCIYLIDSIGSVLVALAPERRAAVAPTLSHHAQLVLDAAERASSSPDDRRRVRAAYQRMEYRDGGDA